MRRHVQALMLGIGLGIVIILLLEGLVLAQAPSSAPRAALVNGDAITLAEVDDIIRLRATPLTRARRRRRFGRSGWMS